VLEATGLSSYGFTYDNWGANPATTPGTSVTPGASNAEGTFTQIASSGNIAQDCYWLYLAMSGGNTSANQKDHLLDIGVDPAGGTSYTAVISNIVCGASASAGSGVNGPVSFLFPFFIKSGSSVAVRIQGNNATAGTVRVSAKFWGQPASPENVPVGQYAETIGTITNSQGVSFTPGNAADGTWASLGTTTNALWWWQLGVQLSNATSSGNPCYVDLAYGDATNKFQITRLFIYTGTTEASADSFKCNLALPNCFKPVPGGSTIYVRGRCSAAPDSGWNAVAIGIGG